MAEQEVEAKSELNEETWDLFAEIVELLERTLTNPSCAGTLAALKEIYQSRNAEQAAALAEEIPKKRSGWDQSAWRAASVLGRPNNNARQRGLTGVARAIGGSDQLSKKERIRRCLQEMEAAVVALRDAEGPAQTAAYEAWCAKRDELADLTGAKDA